LARVARNAEIFPEIYTLKHVGVKLRVFIEDIVPYRGKLSPHTIETAKYIGELRYRLKSNRISCREVSRTDVRNWAYERYSGLVIPLVEQRIRRRHEKLVLEGKAGLMTKEGRLRSPSSVWVNDQIIVAAMREEWNVPEPKWKFTPNEYGLSSHSWQALALATYAQASYIQKKSS
jgi:hypothetical protein